MSEKYTIARFTKDKAHFEILVKPNKALSYRTGKISGITEVLATDLIFVDANKGKKASEEQMQSVFETTNPHEIADIILKKGTLQLTTEQRHKMIDDKRKQIIDFISRQAVDPKTKLPHPPLRIENAMKQVRYPIDPYKPVEEQARDIVKLLRPILPLRIEQISLSVTIPVQYAARAYGSIKSFGQIRKEEWRADGSWYGIIEMSAGVYASFLNKLGHITKGNGQTKIIN
ncbi:MAG: ribosome assembly factor SBDS [Candidatus Bathyarchaeota archaeon]|jgi:ribosome maturation protein SDO1|nr:ribosome assembly factor SBDS [Candidatus Bathyarchaeota archaeon]